MSLTPARDEREATKKRDAIEKCGKNMGPHDFIPIEWSLAPTHKRVTLLMCRTCFAQVSVMTLVSNYPDVSV